MDRHRATGRGLLVRGADTFGHMLLFPAFTRARANGDYRDTCPNVSAGQIEAVSVRPADALFASPAQRIRGPRPGSRFGHSDSRRPQLARSGAWSVNPLSAWRLK